MKYLKFEFIDRADMLTKLADYFEGGEPKNCAVVGNIQIIKTPATYDEEGKELTAAVMNDKYAVDVLFYGDYPELAEEVTPTPNGYHTFAGEENEVLYLERYNEKL
tara:strand:- start:869 stop:1186 length:318 start_codon:yes stop_codon:yes gene_type:complete